MRALLPGPIDIRHCSTCFLCVADSCVWLCATNNNEHSWVCTLSNGVDSAPAIEKSEPSAHCQCNGHYFSLICVLLVMFKLFCLYLNRNHVHDISCPCRVANIQLVKFYATVKTLGVLINFGLFGRIGWGPGGGSRYETVDDY